ncbi:MAG: hypothetical protein ABI333_20180 [bacterium]
MKRLGAVAACSVLLVCLHSCERGEPGPVVEKVRSAQVVGGGELPRSTWSRVSPEGEFRVSPVWSPSGKRLVVSGRRGLGLFLLTRDGDAERAVDLEYRGPRRWQAHPSRDVLCVGADAAQGLDVDTGEVVASCSSPPFDDDRGSLVFRDANKRIYHHPRRGTVTLLRSGEPTRRIVEHGAWGVRVSASGRRIAWSTGTLSWAALYVRDLQADAAVLVGTGAHPAWLPDGRLLYTVVTAVRRSEGMTHITEADLHVYDASTGEVRAVTRTPGVAELQPAVSPDGRSVAFSDWRDGSIYVAPLGGRALP